MKLWLHAYRYKVPMGEGFGEEGEAVSEKTLTVKTAKPLWALPEYLMKNETTVNRLTLRTMGTKKQKV